MHLIKAVDRDSAKSRRSAHPTRGREGGGSGLGSVRKKAVWGSGIRLVIGLLIAATSSACGDLQRQGQASSYLIVERLEAASGADPEEFQNTLNSDVLTLVDGVPSIFNDLGEVTFRLGMKDPGVTEPTSANFITVNRYRVRFIRADGRNTPGLDVPYGFDGAMTISVTEGGGVGSFELVRHIAKQEAPLAALAVNGVIISTVAEITFYGRDQTGREVSATATLLVNFGNFADPE
jgi:hypothetical protein